MYSYQEVLCTNHVRLGIHGDEELRELFDGFADKAVDLDRESTDELDFGTVYDVETHDDVTGGHDGRRKSFRDHYSALVSFLKQKDELPEDALAKFVKRRMEKNIRDAVTYTEHRRGQEVEMRDLIPALLDGTSREVLRDLVDFFLLDLPPGSKFSNRAM